MERLVVAWLALTSCIAQAAGGPADVYRVKAAFLYNFAKFVDWPPEAFKDSNDSISICVLGKNPFGSSLTEAVEGKTIGNRKFTIVILSEGAEARVCHILFVNGSERRPVKGLSEAKSPYVLMVGESSEFLAGGGMINFTIQDSNVRFEINLDAATGAKFRISSRLLSLAAGH